MDKQKSSVRKYIAGILVLAMLLPIFSGFATTVKAEEPVRKISSFDELLVFAAASQSFDFKDQTIVLTEDIEIGEIEQSILDHYGIKHLTIGTKDLPFQGTFDGQGHTIKGLKYDPNIIKDANSGLFSFIENATIKNLIVENADLDCIFQGGVIVGYAENSKLENITVLNSKLKISPANNVVSLVTNGGFSGGGIAGIVENSLLYNCEVSGTEVVNNSTAGVTGVGGEGLYMGGLVGWASSSTIEYCRARANYKGEGDSRELRNTVVRNDYKIAVGALGGKSVYAGGIIGGVNNGCHIIDCFSTAKVSFDVANYVAVGSGIAGYAGGITGALRGNSEIVRCHYAGDISSQQYNAVLVIPIIQHNVNLSGIARIVDSGCEVSYSYFKPSAIASGVSIRAVGDDDDNEVHGPRDDATYEDIDFWESKFYDFIGDEPRQTYLNLKTHYNKWVMDYDLGIPVHGKSVMATFDFPGAGKVKIDKTALVNVPAETSDPLSFAIQGVHPREEQAVTLTMELNDRYRLMNWYKKANVEKHEVSDMKEILALTQNDGAKLEGVENPKKVPIQDRDLFAAGVEAEVTFYELDGQTTVADEWYKYDATLKEHMPNPIEGSKFYGWTTIPNPSEEEKGYSAITSTQLKDIKQQGEFYPNGAAVKKEMKLYPIYINSLANVLTEFEGNEQDENPDVTLREGVGRTLVESDKNNVYIDVEAKDGTKEFPKGYQFRGWYKKQADGTEVCVSREYRYKVPDLTEKVTYVARFNYEVEYWAKAFHQGENSPFEEPMLYTTIIHTYKETFQNINGPTYCREEIIGWGTEFKNHGANGTCDDSYAEQITTPLKVYSHNNREGAYNAYEISMNTDFPNSGKIDSMTVGSPINYTFKYIPTPLAKDRYHLQFWTLEKDGGKWTYTGKNLENGENEMNTGGLDSYDKYTGYAMISTDVVFHDEMGNVKTTVQRRYDDAIFMLSDNEHQYKYPLSGTDVSVDTEDGGKISGKLERKASPTDAQMKRNGYQFLGWISGNEVAKDSAEWNYIYDAKEEYCTSNVEKAKPYLLKEYDGEHSSYLDERLKVKETMDLYPVYAKYDVTTTTNIHQIENLPNGINLPNKPSYTVEELPDEFGKAKVTVTAENGKVSVLSSEPDGKKYELMSLICETDGEQQILKTVSNGSEYVYTGEIVAGKSYKFIAVYSPVLVLYHMNDNDTINPVVKDMGERLGVSPNPDFDKIADVEQSYFAGWTQQKPQAGHVWKFASKEALDASKISFVSKDAVVKQFMDLWPVFVKTSIKVNSNIDTVIAGEGGKPEQYRKLVRNTDGSMQLEAYEYDGYVFKGWYTDYKDDGSMGTKVSDKMVVKLKPEQLFEEKTYTAVFNSANVVTYHDMEGNPICKVNVEEGTRSFVNENGDVLDTEPILKMNELLGNSGTFIEWQWKSDDKMITWDTFKNTLITADMELYPCIVKTTAKDSQHSDYTDKVEFHVSSLPEENPLAQKGAYMLNGLFKEEYTQPNLTLHTERQVWNPAEDKKQSIPITELPTKMYTTITEDGNSTYVEASQGPVYTDTYGDALHEFFGKLKLTKEYVNADEDGVVYIDVVKKDSKETRRIPIDVSGGKGTTTVHLPVGEYQIAENLDWNWRNNIKSTSNVDGQGNIAIRIGAEEEVVIRNERVNEKWLDGADRKKNIYQK